MGGFGITFVCLQMDVVATIVLSLQKWFTYRLMTAGPTGFELAADFYKDRNMVRWRHRAVFCVKWNMPLFLLSLGFLLYVKFYKEGNPKPGGEPTVETSRIYQVLAVSVLLSFLASFFLTASIVMTHSSVFEANYQRGRPLLDKMRDRDPTTSQMDVLSTGGLGQTERSWYG